MASQEAKVVEASAVTAPGSRKLLYALTALSAIGGFLFGYDTGVVSGAMLLVRDDMALDDFWHELIVSATIGTAGLLALVGGAAADRFGRKPVILTASVVFVAGSGVMAAAGTKEVLLVGRIVIGVGIGLSSMSVPIYISEAAPAAVRGRLVTVNVAFITGGQLVASVVCGAFSAVPHGWRYMLGLAAAPAALQTLGFLAMPESPRYLATRGRRAAALSVLQRLRGAVSAEYELREIERDVAQEAEERGSRPASALLGVLSAAGTRRALAVGCSMQIFQQLAGINTVMYYSASIITLAGVHDPTEAIWLAAALAAINFVFTFVSMALVERLGRRPLTLASMLGSALCLVLLAASFHVSYRHSAAVERPPVDPRCSYSICDDCVASTDCGFCFVDGPAGAADGACVPLVSRYDSSAALGRCANLTDSAGSDDGQLTWAPDWCPSDYSWLPILGLSLYLVCFASGMGPMPWTINSEIYPLWARGTCNAIATSCNWFFNLLVSLSFLTLTDVMTKHGTFYMYAGLAFLGLIIFYLIVPETKGVPLERIGELFEHPWGLHPPPRLTVETATAKASAPDHTYTNAAYAGDGSS